MRGQFRITSLLLVTTSLALASDRATLTGKIADPSGKPVEGATVIVYRAGVKKGYSTFCPTCYLDCGKRTTTDPSGAFTIQSLNSDLWFDLVVVRDGYAAALIKKVDPTKGLAGPGILMPRAAVSDPARVVRGRVVDMDGSPVGAVVVAPIGISLADLNGRGPTSIYGTIDGLEPFAVSNQKGEFELAHSQPATGILLQLEPRGMAPKLAALATGTERKMIQISDGATIRGRLMDHGKPVAGAEMGLIARNRGGYGANLAISGNPYAEIRIGTQEDGAFVITNVPAPVEWYIYAKMESVGARGATDPVECATTRDNEEVNVGDIQIKPGYRVRGKITLSDGAAIAEGMRVIISSERAWDSQTAAIGPDGRFEVVSLPAGKYGISPAVRRYQLPGGELDMKILVDSDIDNLAIVLDPAARR